MIERASARPGAAGAPVAQQESNENGPGSRARVAFVAAWLLLCVLKAWLAGSVALFGDEAFYWQESRALAAGYSDVPPLTAWLIALGTAVGGHDELGVRWPFLVLGALLPWVVVAVARGIVGPRRAWQAGLVASCLPLAALLGVFALPDVPLTLAIVAASAALVAAMDRGGVRAWALCGVLLALGWLSHYRFAMFYVAGAAFVLGSRDGRALLRERGFWLAQAIGAAGLFPLLWFNFAHDFSALSFQFVERHAWRFDPRALREPLVQALVATPLLFAACVAAMLRRPAERRAGALAWLAGGLLAGYLVIGLFADVERSRFHWPLPAYLVALPLVPGVLAGWRAGGRAGCALVAAGLALALAATLALAALLLRGAATTPAGPPVPWLTDNTRGWHEVAAWYRERLAPRRGADVLIADNFMLAAEIDFALRGSEPVYVLDHPANRKHGRAPQLAIWRRDEQALRASPWRRGLLLLEEASRRPVERPEAYRALCERFGAVRLVDELRLERGRAVFLAFEVLPGAGAATCELPSYGYIDAPVPGAAVSGHATVRGWAMAEFDGVARVDVLLDGEPLAQARYGLARPDVAAFWRDSRDPNQPHVGFEARVDFAGPPAGPHVLALRITDRAGRVRTIAEQGIELR